MKRQITLALVLLVSMMTASALAEEEELIPFVGVYKVNLLEAPEGYSTDFNDPLEYYIYNNTEAIKDIYKKQIGSLQVLDRHEVFVTLSITDGKIDQVILFAIPDNEMIAEGFLFQQALI